MNIKDVKYDVKYVECDKNDIIEKVDDITRYLRLAAEYGCADEGPSNPSE